MPCFSISWSSAKLRESPSEIAASPGACGAEIEARGVRAADDDGELLERRVSSGVVLQKSVKAAALALVGEVHVGDVVRRGVALLRSGEHLLRRNVEEFRAGIDETRDEPRAGDSVDFRTLACHPARVRAGRLAVERAARGLPAFFDAALQILRGQAAPGERLCHALADLVPVHAVRDDAACARQLARPLGDALGIAPQRASIMSFAARNACCRRTSMINGGWPPRMAGRTSPVDVNPAEVAASMASPDEVK